jgi:2-oxoglutarate ferredoxin oxidoreductase subunit beta
MDTLGTQFEITWCPGCGNFGILNAFKKTVGLLEQKGLRRENLVIASGIGCHAKIFDYLALSGIHAIHGRAMATVQGIKTANPDLKVVAFVGDGDAMGEGISHLIFAAKRNADITVVMHDNGVYALTTGQYTPTSEKGFRSPSTPRGSIEEPLNPLVLMLDAGATFVARAYPVKLEHLSLTFAQAIEHKGFSFVQVLQPCVSFNNTYDRYNGLVEILDRTPGTLEEALALARRKERLPLGVFYSVNKPAYHEELYGDWNPVVRRLSREERIAKIEGSLSQS